ncbi:sensor histidine kinase [Demequina aestuarii]|uniref:sensor histidine kinase n=1 Tax=Demequina aestuarii TaxID=327095 RepID=UPI000784410B|nr:sensor histidine kinase [Demequina aestuarii]
MPILVLVLAAGFIGFGSLQDLSSARNAEALIDTLDRARTLRADLQDERAATANFVHVAQDTESKLNEAYGFTDTALTSLDTAITESGAEDPEAIRAQLNAAIGRDGTSYMTAERALQIAPATEESGGWAVFPAEDAIASMQAGYAAAVEGVNALDESLSEDLGLSTLLSALAFRLNVESEFATSLFTEPLAYVEPMEAAAASVDAGVEALRGSAAALGGSEENTQVVAALLEGEDAVASMPEIRADARSLGTGPVSLTAFYTGIIETIVSSSDDVAVAMADRELVSTVQAYGDLDTLVENVKHEEVVFQRLIRAGRFLPGEAAQARTMATATDIALAEAQDASAGISGADEVPPFGSDTDQATTFASVRTQVLTGLDSSLFTARTADWSGVVADELRVYEPLREDMWSRVESGASSNAQNALLSTIVTIVAIVAVIIVSLVIALVIARRIIGPLRRLTTTATAVRQELPRLVERVAIPGETVDVSEVQIPVESRDEVGRLAEAFNGVNAATLAIAGEQAALRGSISEMFVNVARRDQVLLNRQLSSIDEMERSEDNQETLTKLFALDHLATRMRRNSESLLVLAGIDTGRRLRRPMPLSDVVRTASSEIELYERVQLELDADPAMLGHSALTAAHLFAELLENATVFSDPGSAVVVRTFERGDEYVVEIEDSGIGMTEKELDAANARVASTAASEILGAQRLGLFVVGRIARRVGARVELKSEEGAGTLATVTMPRALFAKEEAPAPHHLSSTAVDQNLHAPTALVTHDEAEEITETTRLPEREGARVDAYTPTAVEEGVSLAGRGSTGEPERDSIDALIAADAASAPVAEATNPEDLTSGAAASGLPARRRREAPSPADAQRERASIVGLPARATDAQLSALEAEQAGGFTPAISPTEVTPQSPEQRSSMFRGFRSRRETEQEAATSPQASFGPELPKREPMPAPELEPDELATDHAVAPDAGHTADSAPHADTAEVAGAAGAAAFFSRRDRGPADVEAESAAAPAFEPDVPDSHDTIASVDAPSAPNAAESLPVFRMPKVDVTPSPAATPEPTPVDTPVFEYDDAPEEAGAPAPAVDPGPFVVPSLEADEDEYQAPAPSYEPAPYGGVEQVSLVDDELPHAGSPYDAPSTDHADAADPFAPTPYDAPVAHEAPGAYDAPGVHDAPAPYEAPGAYDTPSAPSAADQPWLAEPTQGDAPAEDAAFAPGFMASPQAPIDHDAPVADAPREPQAASPVEGAVPSDAPAAAWGGEPASESERNPSLDELIQSAVDDETEQRPGFFSRLFGRGRRGDSAAEPGTAASAGAPAAPWAATDAARSASSAPSTPAPGGYLPMTEPVVQPSSWQSAPEPASAPESEAPSSASAPAPWEPAPTSFAPEASSPAPEAAQPEPSASAPWLQSAPQPEAPAPWERAEPTVPAEPPSAAPQSFQPDVGASPEANAWDASQTVNSAEPPSDSSATAYSPDELAKASGWEAAGASALQAAEPEGATTYQPVIQPDNGGDDMGGADLTSAVFSELSSLAAERPKVEKTRAGLQRRRPTNADPVEVTPIQEDASLAPADRDADAVRSRFSSFYSGTKRARDDVAAFERQTEPAEASDS